MRVIIRVIVRVIIGIIIRVMIRSMEIKGRVANLQLIDRIDPNQEVTAKSGLGLGLGLGFRTCHILPAPRIALQTGWGQRSFGEVRAWATQQR